MNIMICGASGLIGTALVEALGKDAKLTLVGRDATRLQQQVNHQHHCCNWNSLTQEVMAKQDIVINLAGENIGAKKWSQEQKRHILQSRLSATKRLVTFCMALGNQSPRLINASAIGIYGLPKTIEQQNQLIFTEQSTTPKPPTDFLSDVASQWEAACQPAIDAGVSVVKCRFAVVLSPHGGALAKMLPSFKLGAGAIIGSGEQPFSWVALPDVVAAIQFFIAHPQHTGAFNIVADEVVSQADFARTLAHVLHRPCFAKLPAAAIKLMFGQMGEELLLNGTQVSAARLKQLGFVFQYPTLKAALEYLLRSL